MSKHPTGASNARVTLRTLRTMVSRKERITVTTAYDATFARMLDEGGADILLVGDSLGNVVQGHETTLPVTLEEMLYHCRAVARGAKRAHLVGDMPFMTNRVSEEDTLRNASRFLSEGGMHAVKMEGGREIADTVARLVQAGIPVMGHVGLTPQAVHAMGGFRVQGKAAEQAERILDDAQALSDAGAYAVVLEGIPQALAARITNQIQSATIGIGAGAACAGQVLVCYDLLGLTANGVPSFVKCYDQFYERGVAAMRAYAEEVRTGTFPAQAHSFGPPSDDVPPTEEKASR